MRDKKAKGRKFVQAYAQAGAYISLGIQFALTILLCLYLGRWLDGKLETAPLFLLGGTLLGTGAGMYNLYKGAVADQKKNEAKEGERE